MKEERELSLAQALIDNRLLYDKDFQKKTADLIKFIREQEAKRNQNKDSK